MYYYIIRVFQIQCTQLKHKNFQYLYINFTNIFNRIGRERESLENEVIEMDR